MKRVGQKYVGHIPTTFGQKIVLGCASGLLSILDPRRVEQVARLGEVTGGIALCRMRDRMRGNEVGRLILKERPLLKRDICMEHVLALPEGTFGREYGEFMRYNGLDPHSRNDVRYVDDEELAYVMMRYREVHDLWHVLFGVTQVSVEREVVRAIEKKKEGNWLIFFVSSRH